MLCTTNRNCCALFPTVEYAYTAIPTYPSGQIGFMILSNTAADGESHVIQMHGRRPMAIQFRSIYPRPAHTTSKPLQARSARPRGCPRRRSRPTSGSTTRPCTRRLSRSPNSRDESWRRRGRRVAWLRGAAETGFVFLHVVGGAFFRGKGKAAESARPSCSVREPLHSPRSKSSHERRSGRPHTRGAHANPKSKRNA